MGSASFRADREGVLDLSRTRGSYSLYDGVWAMGLIASMRPTKPAPAGGYFWHGTTERKFTIDVHSRAQTLASTVFRRRFSPTPLREIHEPLRAHGFYGEYFAPAVAGRHPAVLTIGGSEGGDMGEYLNSALLAAHGYPALDIAYFDEPELPQRLANISLEYFANALRWLSRQPHVDPRRLVVMGTSRGSEAALLLGVHYPTLVHAVIASVPSSVAICSFPGCSGPAWTLHGHPLPYTRQFDQTQPTDSSSAVIPVEEIRGPVFLDCAGMDRIWTSCNYAHAIMQRLNAHHDPYTHILYREPDADHYIGGVPDEPGFLGNDPATEQAREQLWPRLLTFLTREVRERF